MLPFPGEPSSCRGLAGPTTGSVFRLGATTFHVTNQSRGATVGGDRALELGRWYA